MTNSQGRLGGEGWGSSDRGRWATRRKMEVVLRVLRGEDLDSLSREPHVTAAAMAQWRDLLLVSGQAGLRSRESDERDLEISRMRTKIGEITMENELLRERARRAEANHPLLVAEAVAVAQTVSPSAGRRYRLARTCRVLDLPRSTLYAAKQRSVSPPPADRKCGHKTARSDRQLTDLIHRMLELPSAWGTGRGRSGPNCRLRRSAPARPG